MALSMSVLCRIHINICSVFKILFSQTCLELYVENTLIANPQLAGSSFLRNRFYENEVKCNLFDKSNQFTPN